MVPQRFALVAGLVFLLVGLISLIPALSFFPTDGLQPLDLDFSYAYFLNIFPMNILNKVALIACGFWGLSAYSRPGTFLPASIRFSRAVFVIMGTLAVLGIIPQTETLFGLWPLYGNAIWFHGLFAVLGAFYGFGLTARIADRAIPSS